jgi:hypothetical protein
VIPERVVAPFTEAAFRSGLIAGLVALLVGVVVALAWRARRRDPVPVAGLLMAGAAVVVLAQRDELVAGLGAGLVALAGAGLVVDVVPRGRRVLPLLALPGAWAVATATDATQPWAPVAVGATVALGGSLVASFDHHWKDRPLGPGLLVASFAGVFVTVPETREALPVLGAVLPLAVIGWPVKLAALGAGGSLAATGLLAWTVAEGGTFRDSAIVGGLACLGVLVAEPVARALLGSQRARRRLGRAGAVLGLIATQAVVVLLAARVAGLRDDLRSALALAAITLVVALGATAALTVMKGAEISGARPRTVTRSAGPRR